MKVCYFVTSGCFLIVPPAIPQVYSLLSFCCSLQLYQREQQPPRWGSTNNCRDTYLRVWGLGQCAELCGDILLVSIAIKKFENVVLIGLLCAKTRHSTFLCFPQLCQQPNQPLSVVHNLFPKKDGRQQEPVVCHGVLDLVASASVKSLLQNGFKHFSGGKECF